jgi:acyl dehydratase
MESGTEKGWLLSAIIIGLFCPFFRDSSLNSPATAEAELQTGLNSLIFMAPVQPGGNSYGAAI